MCLHAKSHYTWGYSGPAHSETVKTYVGATAALLTQWNRFEFVVFVSVLVRLLTGGGAGESLSTFSVVESISQPATSGKLLFSGGLF